MASCRAGGLDRRGLQMVLPSFFVQQHMLQQRLSRCWFWLGFLFVTRKTTIVHRNAVLPVAVSNFSRPDCLSQKVSFPQVGVKKKYLKPPPRLVWMSDVNLPTFVTLVWGGRRFTVRTKRLKVVFHLHSLKLT